MTATLLRAHTGPFVPSAQVLDRESDVAMSPDNAINQHEGPEAMAVVVSTTKESTLGISAFVVWQTFQQKQLHVGTYAGSALLPASTRRPVGSTNLGESS